MNATTVAVDLAKNVFELAVADCRWRVIERHRLTRAQFERWFENRNVGLVVMEACGSAHPWGRTLRAREIEVRLLPAKYVRAYVKRNKTRCVLKRAPIIRSVVQSIGIRHEHLSRLARWVRKTSGYDRLSNGLGHFFVSPAD